MPASQVVQILDVVRLTPLDEPPGVIEVILDCGVALFGLLGLKVASGHVVLS